jgi:hypothetical protein
MFSYIKSQDYLRRAYAFSVSGRARGAAGWAANLLTWRKGSCKQQEESNDGDDQ